ncbi:MAG: SDR family NAD(P)-dependent oxidoreductase [Cyanobacteriota bacterium]|nr:SDR family NAD(P)-dependent oxidoreductase [Cyanobacteriota bacterium]
MSHLANPLTPEQFSESDIAIVGMSCRFPGAENIDQFWKNLCNGVESISFFSESDLDLVDPSLLDRPNYVKAGGVLSNIDEFDADFFGYSAKEAEIIDPQQRIFLECAWEALENAGYNPQLHRELVGVYAGSSSSTYLINNVCPSQGFSPQRPFLNHRLFRAASDLHIEQGNNSDHLPMRVSFKLGLTGPSVNVQTTCSTSLVAVHLACQSLHFGECDVALAGGVSIFVPHRLGYLYREGMILSPDGHCRAFDAEARGTVFGNGAGVVVLKLLSKAVADGDSISAVIKGSAVNNDGADKMSYTAPSVRGQVAAISEALAVSSIDASTISYVEAHGTGTALGDPIEVTALREAFDRSTSEPMDRTGFCAIGSVKTNIGHLDDAAGIAGLIKTVLALKHRLIPPSLNFSRPNPNIDFSQTPFYVNTELTPWNTEGIPPRAGVSSFGMGGTNCHLVLEAAPEIERKPSVRDRPLHLLTLSAKTETALQDLARRYADYLDTHREVNLGDICFSANTGRHQFGHRLAMVADSHEQLTSQLQAFLPESELHGGNRGKIGFLFTGQGAQHGNMGRQLYQTQPAFRKILDRCANILKDYRDVSLLDILYGDRQSELDNTAYTQPALFAIEYALAQVWKAWGIEPDVVMGHSVGEYVAACLAGVFSLEDGLKLIAYRSSLMQALPQDGEMVAVLASESAVRSIVSSYSQQVSIAAINGPQSLVISGARDAIGAICQILDDREIKTKKLRVSHAFHSPLMRLMLAQFERVAREIRFSPPQIPLVSNVTGELITEAVATPEYWCDHICEPVRFARSMERLRQQDVDTFIEIGPKPTLLNMGRRCDPGNSSGLWLSSLDPERGDWQTLLTSLAELYRQGYSVDWQGFDGDFWRQRVHLPTYAFQRRRYWVEPSRDRQPTGRFLTTPASPQSQGHDREHPLLGIPLSLAGTREIRFQGQVSQQFPPWQRDHRVFATTILPGTAYLEMALAAGASLSGQPCRLEGATIQKALEIPESGEALPLQMVLKPEAQKAEAQQAYKFEIFSPDVSSQAPSHIQTWNLHATGKIFLAETVKPDTINLLALQQQMAEEIPVDRLYEKFQQQQIDYGPSFHAVDRVWRDRDRALGYIVLPEGVAADLEGYQLHPVLLDTCLQVLDATLLEERDETYVPVFVQTVQRFGQPSPQMWCDARLHPRQDDRPETLEADLTLFDLQGEPIAQMTGLQLRRVRRQTMLGKTENPETDWLYEVVWREQHRATRELQPPQPRHWLLFADRSESIDRLAALLRDRGETCTLVFPGPTYEALGPNEYQLNPAAVEQFGQLWASLPPIDGIVHAWGWEQPETLTAKTLENEALLSCGSLLHLVQTAIDRRLPLPPVWAIAKGCPGILEPSVPGLTPSLMWGMAQTIPLEHPDLRVIRVNLDPMVSAVDSAQTLLAEVFPLPSAESIEDQIAFRQGIRYVARLARRQTAAVSDGEIELAIADDRPFALKIAERGTPDRLEIQATDRQPPAAGEVEIRAIAAGLNFIDVLNVLGLYPGEPPLGIECAGEIAAKGAGVTGLEIGDAVMAIASGSFSQYVTVDANLVVPQPANCTVEEAATIPESFFTAYWSLHHLAGIAPGDRVLIHAASGGVGQAAVQLALLAGAEVYATASPSKWHALEALGVRAVMNSRTLDFAEEIMARTDGQGADIILNSLTGEGFIAKSVSVLAKNGRFLELAKRDIWSPEQMARVRSDVSYFKIDTTRACREQAPQVQQMLRHLVRQVENHQLKPLPKTVFPLQSAIRAFRTMQQAKHIGKIVLAFPTAPSTIVRADGSYLITGGMGGLGLRVARWLVEKGARHLILIGRKGLTAAIAPQIEELEGTGARVTCLRADVSDESQMRTVFADLAIAAPPLFGIIHAAGVLEDGVLQQQTWERFARVMAPKVQGAWNLHTFTQNQPLDFFVLFSSSASVLGAPGQANYGAANAFLDALATYRRSQGLPGLSINWGPWEEVGMTAALQLNDRLREKGEDSIPPEAGLQILEQLLQRSVVQVGVMPIDWSRFFDRSGRIPPFFSELYDPPEGRGQLDAKEFRQSLQRLPVEERKARVTTHLQTQAAKILGMDTAAQVPTDKRLVDLGLDSLMAIEFLSLVQSSLGISLSSALLFERPTIDALVDYLLAEWVEIPEADGVSQRNGKTDELKAGERSTAIAIQPEGTQLPLFCVAGILGSVFDFYGLARYLNPDRPLYGLRSYGLMPGETPLTSMADIASQQIQAIQAIQPQGPYHLAGHSFGGKVAFEMARQLQERGEAVSFLAILDIPAVLAGRDRALERWDDPQYIIQLAEIYAGNSGEKFEIALEHLQELDTDDRLNLLFGQLQQKGQKLTWSELQQMFSVYRSNTIADTAYIPQKSNIPITLLRATDIGQFDFLPDAAATDRDPTWGWHQRSTQPIELHQLPGNHFTMVKEPHVQILARQLNISLRVNSKN